MAYTTYPQEAWKFSTKASNIKDKIEKTKMDLKKTNSIFKIDSNEDYLTLKTLESTEKLINTINSAETLLATESQLVTNKANQLENEAKELAESKEEEDGDISE